MKIPASVFRSLGEIISSRFVSFFQEHANDFDEDSLKAFLQRFDDEVVNFLSREHSNLSDVDALPLSALSFSKRGSK